MIDWVGTLVARAMDAGVRWQLARLPVETPALGSWAPADPREFWAASRVHDPAEVTAGLVLRHDPDGVEVRNLSGPSQGPGTDPGSRRLQATAHLRPGRRDLPFVLVIHGLASPSPWYEERRCRALTARGAHTARIDLPLDCAEANILTQGIPEDGGLTGANRGYSIASARGNTVLTGSGC